MKKWNWVLLSLQWLVYGICVIDGICIAQGLSFLGTTLGNLVSGLFFAILAGRFFLIWHMGNRRSLPGCWCACIWQRCSFAGSGDGAPIPCWGITVLSFWRLWLLWWLPISWPDSPWGRDGGGLPSSAPWRRCFSAAFLWQIPEGPTGSSLPP